MAASINLDSIAVVRKSNDNVIRIISDGYDEVTVDLNNLEFNPTEKESTLSLVKGVATGFAKNGHKIGGFCAYITSDVLIGAGLSSSTAFETLIGTILSGLYNKMNVSPVEIAIIEQYAENVFLENLVG